MVDIYATGMLAGRDVPDRLVSPHGGMFIVMLICAKDEPVFGHPSLS